MARESSTEKGEKSSRKKKYAPPRTSPEFEALIGRLRYVGDFLFGGNLQAYAAAVGLTEFWLKKILAHESRVRISTFTRFVKSGLVSAEWLFCGTGPMLMANVIPDDISGVIPQHNMNSRYATLNTGELSPLTMPELPAPPAPIQIEQSHETSRKTTAIARQIFISSINQTPVILFINAAPIISNIASIVTEMLQKKYVTGVALTLAAAEADYQQAGNNDLGAFNDVVIRGAKTGLGLGEALGAFIANQNTGRSVLAAAYSLGVPVTVHGSIGESPLHFCPAKTGAELGAAYGATTYVDSLVFAEQVRRMAGDKMSLFLNMGSALPGLPLFSSAMAAAQEGLGLVFNRVKISRITSRKVESKLDACVCGPYDQSLTHVLQACDAIFEGGFDVYTNQDTGEQFAAFGLLNECAERVRKCAKKSGKRKG